MRKENDPGIKTASDLKRPRFDLQLAEASSIGIVFVVSGLIGMGLGHVIDLYFDTTPWGLFTGTFLGFVSGFLSLLRMAWRMNKEK